MIFGAKFCEKCGHAFKRNTGKRVAIREANNPYNTNLTKVWFCAEHRPAWDLCVFNKTGYPRDQPYFYYRDGVRCDVDGKPTAFVFGQGRLPGMIIKSWDFFAC